MRHELIGFKRHLRPEIVYGEAVYLIAETGVTAVQGQHTELLASLLDGTRSLAELLRDLPADVTADQVKLLLDRLGAAGLVGTRHAQDAATADSALAYWDAAGLDSSAAARRTREGRVRLVSAGRARHDVVASALRRAGLAIAEPGAAEPDAAGPDVTAMAARDIGPACPAPHDLTVVVCDNYLDPGLRDVDEEHRRAGRPWLVLKTTGTQVWVGPFFIPGDGPCWQCLAARLAANRPAEAHVQAVRGRQGPAARPEVGLPSVAATAAEVAALEATKWLAGHRHPGQREIWIFDSLDLRVTRHAVHARPQCPGCGEPDLVRDRAVAPVRLRARAICSRDGGHRSASPQQVLDRYRHLVSPVTGVIKEIRRDTRGHEFFNSYRSGTNAAASAGLDGLRSTLRCENGGKGVTPLHAEVGALCEALERQSGAFHGDEARVSASFRTLGDQAVHPDTVQLYHPRQFADRAAINAAHGSFQYVPEPFDDHAVLDWTPVWSVTNQCHRLLPTGALYYGAPAPASVTANSNGCAAGAHLEDAVLQGLLELVERDAVALWWYNRTRMPAVDLDSAGDGFVDELRAVYAELGREVWALDLTADLGIPVVVALSRRLAGEREDVMLGFGAHLDPKIAVRRALTELNQVMPAIATLRERDWRRMDADLRHWLRHCSTANQPYLLPDPAAPARRVAELRGPGYPPAGDLLVDIESIRVRLEALRLELLVLDQTRPDIGLPVVRVIVPGLRHFWSRLALGRLYEVPVTLGRVERPAALDELNPVPMFL